MAYQQLSKLSDMDNRQSAIEYLESRLNYLFSQRDELHKSLSEVETAITNISRTLDYLLESDSVIEMEVEDYAVLKPEAVDSMLNQQTRVKPDDLKLSRFKGHKLADIILQVLREVDGLSIMTIDSLIKAIYNASTEEKKKACRASLTAALHRMEQNKTVKRIKQGTYQLNPDFEVGTKYKEINGYAR
jgi:hypothetical protein